VLAIEPFQECPQNYGLTHSYLAGNSDKSLAPVHAIEECRKRLSVTRKEIEKGRIWGYVEGLPLELEEI
jgi:hypothetical protein